MLVRKTEPEQQKGLNQDEALTRVKPRSVESESSLTNGKGQQVERDKKGGDGDNSWLRPPGRHRWRRTKLGRDPQVPAPGVKGSCGCWQNTNQR